MVTCPECDYDEIDTEDFEEGDKLSCPECGKNLVVVGPDELDFAGGDDDDDDDDDGSGPSMVLYRKRRVGRRMAFQSLAVCCGRC